MPRNDFDKAFARELQKLNTAQREAVETIEGPLMIVAGPGTGKTQVVAMRIGQILQKTQLNPRNVLALTFTEAGVTALQKRLEKIIGPDAYQVTVATFHSFANDVVSTFPYLFGFVQEATQATELEQLQIIHRLIERNDQLHALRPVRTPTFHVRAIGEAIRKLKQEGVAPEALRQLAEEEFSVAGQAKRSAAATLALKRQLLLNTELADVYEAYQAELKRLGRYDYEDMILFALEALTSDTDVKAYYQERYQYVLVDEYQDTNNAQNTLVERLVDFFEQPNVCVVGDDKQAIYRFQGASVANMLHFAKRYPTLKVVSLRENYRSVASILRAADQLIGHNQHQLGEFLNNISSSLIPTRAKETVQPMFVCLPSQETEFEWVCQSIKQRLATGVATDEVAVLFRTNDGVKRFREYAQRAKLPLAGGDATDLAGEPVVQQLLGLLQAVTHLTERRLVIPALRLVRPFSPLLVARYANQLDRQATQKGASLTTQELNSIKEALDQLAAWSEMSHTAPLVETVQTILCESRLLQLIEKQPNSLEQLELIRRFLSEVRQFALSRPSANLQAFLSYIGLLRDYRLRLNVPRLLPARDGIFVSTVHAAKGLEFDSVFLPSVSARAWNDRGRRELIKLPGTILDLKNWREDALEDERRLFYVAITRAKNYLSATLAQYDDEGREQLPSQFVSELGDTIQHQTLEPTRSQTEQAMIRTLRPVEGVVLKNQEQRLIRELLTSRPFSYTDYKVYQLCPQQFLLSSLLKFPSKTEPRLVYGSILHRALELFFKKYRSTKKLPTMAGLQKFLTDAARTVEPFPGRTAIIDQARTLLTAYYPNLQESPIPVGVEYSLSTHRVLLEEVWVTGKFDRIDPLDVTARTVRIVDYKTGSQAKTRNAIEGKTKGDDSTLREQLIFYSLLTTLDRHFPYHATEFALLFLDDAHTFRQENFTVDSGEREALGQAVVKTYREILERTEFVHEREEFDRGCEVCELFRTLS